MKEAEPEPKKKIWEIPVDMPRPLSELEDDDLKELYWYTAGGFANILFWVDEPWRVHRMLQLVLQLLSEHDFDMLVDQNVFEQMQEIMQVSRALNTRQNRSANAKLCIEILKEAFECDNEDEDYGYGNIFMVCIGRLDVECFKFLQQIAAIIYSAEDLKKLFCETLKPPYLQTGSPSQRTLL